MKRKKYEIYIGLKDQDTYEEIFTVEDFVKILSEHCIEKRIGFSVLQQVGGYSHNLGYVTETSVRITLFGISEDEVVSMGDDLKKLVNTDTIMITSEESEYFYL